MPSAALARTTLAAAAGSHPGLQRDNNEDRFHCDPQRGIFLVVDGVGGQAAGEKAAETALTLMRARLERETGAPADRVREAITLANNEIFRLAATEAAWAGMACVLTVALVKDGRVTVGHVGDTRLYAFSGGAIRKITHDHSPVGEREDRGDLDELEAMRHPRRNEIYRDVGSQHHEPGDEEFIEILEFPFQADSALLLCTDGLSDMVPSSRVSAIVAERAGDPALVVERLIEAANAAGGKDNVTAVFAAGSEFAEAVRRAPGPAAGNGSSSSSGGGTGRSWMTTVALLIYGLVAGLVLAAAAMFLSDTVVDRVNEAVRPDGWSRTWQVGAGQDQDFASIQAALERAQPGDVIEVDNGVYDLPLVLPAGIHLVARKPREAILRMMPAGAASASPGIRIEGQSRLSGFKIEASGAATAVAAGEGETLLEDLEIVGATQAALVFGARSRGTLRGSHLHDNAATAVVVASEALPRLLHNVIAGNGRPKINPGLNLDAARQHPAVPAIVLQQGASATLFGNIIAGNGDDQVAGLPPEKRADLLRDNMIGTLSPSPPRPPAPAGGRGRRQ